MYYNFSELSPTEAENLLNADVCIVGSGAAGITMALQFIRTPLSVVVLEGGVVGVSGESQALYHGKTVANGQNHDQYLAAGRIRMFGGTTGHWAGYCRPFDKMDFEERSWVPDSGWPISMSDLVPFYEMSSALLQIKPFNMDDDLSAAENRVIDNNMFTVKNYHMSPPTRFHETFREGLRKANNVSVVFDANVVNINLTDDGAHVSSLDIASLLNDEKKATVRAKKYVLATGGIENTKILLNSRDVQKNGVGNDRGLVGKYFMEHPEYDDPWSLALALDDDISRNFLNFRPTMQLPAIMPTEYTQTKYKLMNASIVLHRYKSKKISSAVFSKETDTIGALDSELASSVNYQPYATFVRTEMPPIESNKCYLVADKDTFGNQNVALRYGVNELTDHTLQTLAAVLGAELGRSSLGRMNDQYKSGEHVSKMRYGWHHMGTTRMSSNPDKGVVDSNCRVFGVSNLYLSGSSVFPTSSYANPTFTIVALALRLAEHLKEKLR